MTDRELLDEAMIVLSDAMRYVTWNDCAGNKCRTPSCHACSSEPEDPEELFDRASALRKNYNDQT